MKPKEKAKQLITRFSNVENRLTYIDTRGAKICALLCVDEIIVESTDFGDDIYCGQRLKYWQEVKEQITQM
ncbi:MAG TPA: hypothetical protein DCG75_01645 [Bacteroidales bacterium]|nr:hypothetical protein [Bacteroidales bacterium]